MELEYEQLLSKDANEEVLHLQHVIKEITQVRRTFMFLVLEILT